MNQSLMQPMCGLFAIILMGIGIIALYHYRNQEFHYHQVSNRNPEEIVLNGQYQQYNLQGALTENLTAQHTTHYLAGNITTYTNPALDYVSKDNTRWHITALQGTSTDNAKTVYLHHDVRIRELADQKQPGMLITTTKMTLHPRTQIAETQAPVTITRPDSVVKGVGLHANFKTGIMKLLSHSHGVYEQPAS